jgi:multiple antibiotic resistance protein
MEAHLFFFLGTTIKLFALMTPPAVLSAFLSGTRHYDAARKRYTARRTAYAVFIIGIVLYFLGEQIFNLFGFTLDAFRIGAGALLFLAAVSLMHDNADHSSFASEKDDISVVPLARPLCMGPASIGTMMIVGASVNDFTERLLGALSLFVASCGILGTLLLADKIEKMLGPTGIAVLAKLTGLLLAAIAAQVIFTGLQAFIN